MNALPQPKPFKHLFCSIVHENVECMIDLVRNLRFFEPDSAILVYDGTGGSLLPPVATSVLERFGVILYPQPRPLTWGRLHECVFDCLEFAQERLSCDALTFVDSDQLLVRRGYAQAVQTAFLDHPRAGMLATPNPSIGEEWETRLAPMERALWEPFLDRFPSGREEEFPRRWIFWPGTVISIPCATAIYGYRGDPALVDILERSQVASEEIVFTTLTALGDFEVISRPWNDEWVRWRRPLRIFEVEAALADPTCFWLHPITRQTDDPARAYLRRSSNNYEGFTPSPSTEQSARPLRVEGATPSRRRWPRKVTNWLVQLTAR